jgi:hypothetical protein
MAAEQAAAIAVEMSVDRKKEESGPQAIPDVSLSDKKTNERRMA